MADYVKHPQGNPQTSIDAETYRAYVAAAITGLVISDPKAPVKSLTSRAHAIAEETVMEQNRRGQLLTYNYVNIYVFALAGLALAFNLINKI